MLITGVLVFLKQDLLDQETCSVGERFIWGVVIPTKRFVRRKSIEVADAASYRAKLLAEITEKTSCPW